MRRLVELLPTCGFVVAVATLIVNAVVTVDNLTSLGSHTRQLAETRDFLRSVGRMRLLFADAETGLRGFLLTGDQDYLQPYRSAEETIESEMDNARRLAEHRPDDRPEVLELLEVVAAKRVELAGLVDLGMAGRADQALESIKGGRGKAVTDRARALIRSIDGRVDRFYRTRARQSEEAIRKAGVSFTLASTLATLLLGLAFHSSRREARRRERSARMVRQHERWLTATVESIGDGVIATDPEGRVLVVNPVAEALTGHSSREAIGRPIGEIFRVVDERTRQPAANPVARVVRDGSGVRPQGQTILIAKDGRETSIDDTVTPIRGERGDVLGVVMVLRDIAERRSHEAERDRLFAEARVARLRLQDLIMQTPAMITTTRGPDHLVELINPTSLISTGREDAADVVGHPFDQFFPEAQGRELREMLDRVYHDGERFALDEHPVKLFRPEAREYVDAAANIVFLPTRDAFGSIDGILIHAVEVTDQIEARRTLEILARDLRAARDAAEEANRSKDQFLAVLSHELRTPLNPILLAVSAMLDKDDSPPEIRPTLLMIRQNVELEARLIDDLLDVMRIIRGKMALQWGVADVHTLIREALSICRGDLDAADLRVVEDLGAAERMVNADPARLQQVFWNLIKNAVKFTPPGGTVAIRTWNETDAATGPDRLLISVSDTGIGIEPEVAPLVFEPFRQAETSIIRRFGGLGLGLAISRSVVEAHGGLISVSSPGKDRGTSFTVALRALPDAKTAGPAPAPRVSPASGPLKILLVEDDRATLRILARLLRNLNHEVTTADCVGAALDAFGAGGFDLVISDIGLPDGSGLDLIREILKKQTVPAVALTGYGMQEDYHKSRLAGFSAHLTKPIDFQKLEAVIRDVVA